VAAYSDPYIYAMIRVGRGVMPEYGSRITHFDRWHVVNYVRRLQTQAGNIPAGAED
jgi:mono/diheme cytochrome c family protein